MGKRPEPDRGARLRLPAAWPVRCASAVEPSSRPTLCARLASAAALSLVLAPLAFAQGGAYRGPRLVEPASRPGNDNCTMPGPGGSPPAPSAPSPAITVDSRSSSEEAAESAAWEVWWALHKQPYLWPAGASAATGSARDDLRTAVVPLLRATLERTEQVDLQTSCLIALARLGDAAAEPDAQSRGDAIRPFLFSPSLESGESAALALGILGDPEHVTMLTTVLEDSVDGEGGLRESYGRRDVAVPNRLRALAAYGLGFLGARASHDVRVAIQRTLLRMLDGEARSMERRDVPVACITASGLLPLDWDPEDEGELRAEPPAQVTSRQGQLRALLALRDDASISYLTRAHAPTAMARLIAAEGVPPGALLRAQVIDSLLECLAPDSPEHFAIQQSCALALGALGDGDADPGDKAVRAALMRAARGAPDLQVRKFASIALAQASSRVGGGADPLYGTRTSNKGENTRSFFLSELAKGKTEIRGWTALSLGILERALQDTGAKTPAEVRLTLRTLVSDSSRASDQRAFALACGLVRDREATGKLLELLGKKSTGEVGWTKPDHHVPDPPAGLRCRAAEALGLLGDPAAIEGLRAAWRATAIDYDSAECIAAALHLLGDEQLPDLLHASIQKPAGLGVRMASCIALGRMGEHRSLAPLAARLSDDADSGLARSYAAAALGLLAAADRVPWNAVIASGVNYCATTPTLLDWMGGVLDLY